MANRLGIKLLGKTVVLKRFTLTGTGEAVRTRLFHCSGGRGCDPQMGSTLIYGHFLANPAMPKTEECTIDGETDIERLAEDREIEVV